MKSRLAVLGVAAFAIAAASVSAAVLPSTPVAHPAPAVWHQLPLSPLAFPAGASVDHDATFVITSPEEYAAFVASVPSQDVSGFPRVDFGKSFLVAASGGLQDLGNDLFVTEATTDGHHVIVDLTQQVDNPNHCRVTHNIHFIGRLAVIERPAGVDISQPGVVGFERNTVEMPYDRYYNCGCPEM